MILQTKSCTTFLFSLFMAYQAFTGLVNLAKQM